MRALLIACASGHQHLAVTLLHDIAREGRRQPVLRVGRLDVVHHVHHQRPVGASVEEAPDPGVAVGRHEFGLGESHRCQVGAEHPGHLPDTSILGADGRLADPALQVCHVLVQVLFDVAIDGLVVARIGGYRGRGEGFIRRNLEPGPLRGERRRRSHHRRQEDRR